MQFCHLYREIYGGARRDRTDDLMLAKHALYQLSYGPDWSGSLVTAMSRVVVGPGRLELPTLRLSGVRSNQLSYGPMTAAQGYYAPLGSRSHPSTLSAAGELERETETATSRTCLGVFGRPIENVSSLEVHP